MPATKGSMLKIGRTESGYWLGIEGAGTLRESVSVEEYVTQALESSEGGFALDLRDCEYLDSTFLGCLVGLHKRFNMRSPHRFVVVASSERASSLFGAMPLQRLLTLIDSPGELLGPSQRLNSADLRSDSLGQHSMQCHRRLADLGGPNQEIFRRIADQLERELNERQAASASHAL